MFIIYAEKNFLDPAREIAARYGWEVVEKTAGREKFPRRAADPATSGRPAEAPYLLYDASGLSFLAPHEHLQMQVDYLRGATAYRLFAVGNSCEPLLAALGLNKGALKQKNARGEIPYILDAGAGLGRDGLVLAAAGAKVLMCERSPVMAALLADGLRRAENDEKIGAVVRERLALHSGDAREILNSRGTEFSAVYFDPMFPERQKSALVKKEMRLARMISGDDADAPEILRLAREKAPLTVVKRPLHAPALLPEVWRSVKGTRVRYDLYEKKHG